MPDNNPADYSKIFTAYPVHSGMLRPFKDNFVTIFSNLIISIPIPLFLKYSWYTQNFEVKVLHLTQHKKVLLNNNFLCCVKRRNETCGSSRIILTLKNNPTSAGSNRSSLQDDPGLNKVTSAVSPDRGHLLCVLVKEANAFSTKPLTSLGLSNIHACMDISFQIIMT